MVLQKKLTLGMLVLLTINAIVGTGLYFSPSIAASIAGPNSLISWVIAAIIAVVMAMCFAELSGMFEKAGGVYEYTKRGFGKFVGFLAGWSAWVIANMSIAMLVIGGLGYLSAFISLSPLTQLGLALAFVLGVNYISYKGIDVSIKVIVGFTIITLISVSILIFAGLVQFNPANIHFLEMIPKASILIAVYFVMETFFGWESVTYLSEETKNATQVIPKALLIGTAIIIILVLGTVLVMLGGHPWQQLATSQTAPMDIVAGVFSGNALIGLNLVFVITIIGAATAWIISTPRLIYAMAKDKVLPMVLGTISKKTKTPVNAIFLQTILTCFVLISQSYRFLLEVAIPLVIIMYSLTILSIIKLRIEKPNLKRTFKMPFGNFLPAAVVGLLFALMFLSSDIQTIMLGLLFLLVGIPLYIIVNLGYNKGLIKKFQSLSAWITYKTYENTVSKNIIDDILDYLSDATVERVLDLGCGVGVITNKIAQHVIPQYGKVYGIDFCKKEIEIAKHISKQNDIKNTEFIYGDFYKIPKNKRLDKNLRNLDAVIGIGVIGYIDRLAFILKEMNKRMRRNGKFYFVDYDYPGHLLDRPWIEHDSHILKTFNKAGFKAKIWRQKKGLMTFVHIYGEKK